jgi:hypothetical protein
LVAPVSFCGGGAGGRFAWLREGLGAKGPVGFLRRMAPWPLFGVVEGCREAGLTPGGGALIVSSEWVESLFGL